MLSISFQIFFCFLFNKKAVASPAWFCLEEEKKWIIQLMVECRDMHIADEKVSLAMKQSNADDSASSNSSKSAPSTAATTTANDGFPAF